MALPSSCKGDLQYLLVPVLRMSKYSLPLLAYFLENAIATGVASLLPPRCARTSSASYIRAYCFKLLYDYLILAVPLVCLAMYCQLRADVKCAPPLFPPMPLTLTAFFSGPIHQQAVAQCQLPAHHSRQGAPRPPLSGQLLSEADALLSLPAVGACIPTISHHRASAFRLVRRYNS